MMVKVGPIKKFLHPVVRSTPSPSNPDKATALHLACMAFLFIVTILVAPSSSIDPLAAEILQPRCSFP